jgi:hypothetical protein
MEMSGQFYTPAALYLEKKLLVLIEWEDERSSELLWTLVKNILAAARN